jgi:two-component sensor histidine kinase
VGSIELEENDESERKRIQTLREYEQSIPDFQHSFEDSLDLIASHFDTAYTGIQFIDDEKLWIKASRGGLDDIKYMDIADSICIHTIEQGKSLFIGDLTEDPRSKDKFYATGPPYMRSYMGAPLVSPGGYAMGTVVVMDTSPRIFDDEDSNILQKTSQQFIRQFEQYRKIATLEDKNQENKEFLREIHHRLKNNLSLISGLIDLEKMRISEDQFVYVLDTIQKRIQSVATLHQLLYENESMKEVLLTTYLREVVNEVRESFTTTDQQITTTVEGNGIRLPEKQAIYVGLLINELLINSIKHGFKGRTEGKITIQVKQYNDKCHIQVRDNGHGLPDDFDLENETSLGSTLINTFIRQLQGQIDYYNADGACFDIQYGIDQS